MKPKLPFVFGLMMAMMLIVTGCSKGEKEQIQKISDLSGKVVGIIALGGSEKAVRSVFSKDIGGEVKEVVFFDKASDEIAALRADKIDAFMTLDFVADYYLKRNTNLKIVKPEQQRQGTTVMVVRSEDQGLKEDLDKAITILRENGTLKVLQDKWITNLPASNEPSNKEIAKIKNAKTIYVGVSGDSVPLDYIAADGRPAGYNVAILTEIGKLLNINFEFVSIESKAKFMALSSKKIDLIFLHFLIPNSLLAELQNNSWIATKPYYEFKSSHYLVKQ